MAGDHAHGGRPGDQGAAVRLRTLALLGAAVTAVAGGIAAVLFRATRAGEAEPGAILRRGDRVALVGDSHLAGVALGDGLRRLVDELGGQVAITEQHNGWSAARYVSSDRLVRFQSMNLDAAVVVLGGNNRQARADYTKTLRALLSTLAGVGIKRVLWIGPAHSDATKAPEVAAWHDRTTALQRELLPELARETNLQIAWIDSNPWTLSGQADDGVHFTLGAGGGYAGWLDGLATELA